MGEHQKPAEASHGGVPFPVLDAPLSWLVQLCSTADRDDGVRQLFATCKALRDICLSTRLRNVEVHMDNKTTVQFSYRCLKLAASKITSRLCLGMKFPSTAVSVEAEAAAFAYMAVQDNDTPNAMSRVSILKLEGVGENWLDMRSVVPYYTILACPNLEVFNLEGMRILHLPAADSHVPEVDSINRVNFLNCSIDVPAQKMANQLRALPNLRGMTIRHCAWPNWAECVSEVGEQMLSLYVDNSDLPEVPTKLDIVFPNLWNLDLTDLVVDDDTMEMLLNLELLQVVGVCSFHLTRNFNHRECSWQSVTIYDVCVTSLSYFPNPSETGVHIKSRSRWFTAREFNLFLPHIGSDESSQAVTAAAIQQAEKWGGLQCSSSDEYTVVVDLDVSEDSDDGLNMVSGAQVAAALPLVAKLSVNYLVLRRVQPVTTEVVTGIVRYCSRPNPYTVQFHNCTWAPGVLSSLVESLHKHLIVLYFSVEQSFLTDAQLMELGGSVGRVQLCSPGLDQLAVNRLNDMLVKAGKPGVIALYPMEDLQ